MIAWIEMVASWKEIVQTVQPIKQSRKIKTGDYFNAKLNPT